ncbi:XRE family transcriptional regulator [Pandoraea sputorum]
MPSTFATDTGRLKARLVMALDAAMTRNLWTYEQAASALGISTVVLSRVLRRQISSLSIDELLRFLGKAGCSVLIHVRPTSRPNYRGVIEVHSED